jgi:uncharacterized protein YqjF (DUF2071 family)
VSSARTSVPGRAGTRARRRKAAHAQRPWGVPLLHQSWRHLVFVHWSVPVSQLRPLVPPSLPLDTWQGQAYVGLVAFAVKDNRMTLMPPFPLLSRFYEVNLRTYVRPAAGDPGVYFFSLDASNAVIAGVARASYGLPYHAAKAEWRTLRAPGQRTLFTLSMRRLALEDDTGCDLRYSTTGAPAPAVEGTLAHFLIERYVLYTASGENVSAARVHHEPYPVQGARLRTLRESLSLAAGLPKLGRPALAHYARGVDVGIFRKTRVR